MTGVDFLLAIRLRRSGKLKLPDAIIAATALASDAQLLTLDQRLAQVVEAQRRPAGPQST